MRRNRETRSVARKLFRNCLAEGRLDEPRVRTTIAELVKQRPRHTLGILLELKNLVRSELEKSTLLVESSVPLADVRLREIESRVAARFKSPLTATHHVNPALVGGLRLKIGSHVWDGSIAARLGALLRHN